MTGFYDVVLRWLRVVAPECIGHFVTVDLPRTFDDWRAIRLCVPWLQDPVQQWSPSTYETVLRLQERCDERGIPVLNRVENLTNAGKTEAGRRIAPCGMRVAPMALLDDLEEFRKSFAGLSFPLFVREDWGHGGPIVRAETPEQARAIPLERFQRPVAIQIIDVKSPHDGLFHKYRYFTCGSIGVSHHVQVSQDWVTRGWQRVINEATRAEELAYIGQPDVNHTRLQSARRALELDMVAFDYGYTADGEVVVWEANPFPRLQFGATTTVYRNRAMHRSIAAMVHTYLDTAGLPVPAAVRELVQY